MRILILGCDDASLGAAGALCARLRVNKSAGKVTFLSRPGRLRELEKEIVNGRFEAVAAMHPDAACALARLRRSGRLAVPVLGIWSDYRCAPGWAKSFCQGYALPHPSLVEACVQMGLPKEKLRVTGIPVYSGTGLDRITARQALHLPRGGHLVLVPGGRRDVIDALLSLPDFHPQVAVLCGDEKTRAQLTFQYALQPRVFVHGTELPIELWLDACSVLFTEPKAVILARAAARRVPMVLTGTREGTADLLVREGAALFARDPRAGARAVRLLCQSSARAGAMGRAQSAFADPDAAKSLCAWLACLVKK